MSPLTVRGRMMLFGNGRGTATTLPVRHMRVNSKAHTITSTLPSFGTPRLKINASFFAWLLIQSKILTADNLAARGWPHNNNCMFCDQEPETPSHLCFNCVFAKEFWEMIANWTSQPGFRITTDIHNIGEWWMIFSKNARQEEHRDLDGIVITVCWNIWKERNRQTFLNEMRSTQQVVGFVQQDVQQRRLAMGPQQ